MPIFLVLVLAFAAVTKAREWTSAPLDSIPIDSPVLIELIPDSLPIGFDREGRWMLVKTDSVPGSGSPRRLLGIPELALRHGRETVPLAGTTWLGLRKRTAHVAFIYGDEAGKSATVEAWLDSVQLGSVFIPPPPARDAGVRSRDDKLGMGTVFLGTLLGAAGGFLYAKIARPADGSVPGTSVTWFTWIGAAVGFCYTIPIVLFD